MRIFGRKKEVLDWNGKTIRCGRCAHAALHAKKQCAPEEACVHASSPSRVERFFEKNPEAAEEHLASERGTVRAAAVQHVSVVHLPAMLNDAEGEVRWHTALRLPSRFLLRLREDPDREVRIRVASRVDSEELETMIADPDYYVRQIVALRIALPRLRFMMDDPDPQVRRVVAERISSEWLQRMVHDEDGSVRVTVARRLTPHLLHLLVSDEDCRVRYTVDLRAPHSMLRRMVEDQDSIIVFGGDKKLRQLIDEIETLFPLNKGITIQSECPVGLIGDDIEAVSRDKGKE